MSSRTMDRPGELPRSILVTPAALVLGAAIYFSFALDYPGWAWIPVMWLANLCLFFALLGGTLDLMAVCARLGLRDIATSRICLAAQILAFLVAIRVPLTL